MRPVTCNLKPVTSKGLTLLEIIIVIVVLGVAIPPLLNMWVDISWRSVRSEALADASFYAQELMEEIKSKRYDEKTAAPWTDTSNFGAAYDGENSGNRNTFDDADDFVNCTDATVINPSSGYSRSASVEYARLNTASNTWEGCGSQICQPSSNCTACNECCYKRITISVSRPNLTSDVNLVTIVSAH